MFTFMLVGMETLISMKTGPLLALSGFYSIDLIDVHRSFIPASGVQLRPVGIA